MLLIHLLSLLKYLSIDYSTDLVDMFNHLKPIPGPFPEAWINSWFDEEFDRLDENFEKYNSNRAIMNNFGV